MVQGYHKERENFMFIDYRKNSLLSEQKNLKSIQESIIENVNCDKENIAERFYSIPDVGIINCNESLTKLLTESEYLFAYGFFTSSIAIIGMIAEEISIQLATDNNLSKNSTKTQESRLVKLHDCNHIVTSTFNDFEEIRKNRNDCVHGNDSFKRKDSRELAQLNLKLLSNLKNNMTLIFQSTTPTFDNIIKELSSLSSYRERHSKLVNALEDITGDRITFEGDSQVIIRQRHFYVSEIDILGDEFKEITLCDLNTSQLLPVLVDLTYAQANLIVERNIKEKNIIVATIVSKVNTSSVTSEWQLISIDNVDYKVYDLNT